MQTLAYVLLGLTATGAVAQNPTLIGLAPSTGTDVYRIEISPRFPASRSCPTARWSAPRAWAPTSPMV